MIIDTVTRVLRYVVLDVAGVPGSEVTAYIFHDTEEDAFVAVAAAAVKKGHTVVRFCNHDDCAIPDHTQIESDGKGGIQPRKEFPDALNGVELWDAATMQRTFLTVPIEGTDHQMVVRMEPGEFTPDMLAKGQFLVRKDGVFDYVPTAAPEPDLTPNPDSPFKPATSGVFR